MALLEIKGLTVDFGGVRALNGLDLDIREGEILGIIGPNGAGKTTLFNVLCGLSLPTGGKVHFRGEDITGLKPHIVARKGILRTFQMTTLYPTFTVMNNVRLALHMVSGFSFPEALFNLPGYRRKEARVDERALEILRFVSMEHLKDMPANACSFGYQRTLCLALGFAARPKVLLLDEPVTALNPERVDAVIGLIRRIRDEGSTVAIVEHNMRAIFNLCQRIAVLNYGEKLAEGTSEEIRNHPQVIEAYLGRGQVGP